MLSPRPISLACVVVVRTKETWRYVVPLFFLFFFS